MPTANNSKLMFIAKNSGMKVHERIALIKGKDKRISSKEEAKAILAIPNNEVSWLENKNELPMCQMEAMNYLKFGDSNLWDSLSKAGQYLKDKGNVVLERMSNYFKGI